MRSFSRWVRVSRTGAAVAAVVVLGACSSGSTEAPASSAPASSAAASSAPTSSASASSGGGASASASSSASAGTADLAVASSPLGKIVVDRQGRTAYYFDKDKPGSGKSVCSGDCLAAWPAIAPSGSKPTVKGVTAKVGTIQRDDGTAQITLEGRPVYLFVKDTAAGEVKGQGVGGVWYVIAPDGSEVKKPAAS